MSAPTRLPFQVAVAACAHTSWRVSFGTPALANAAKRLFHPTGMFKLYDATPVGFRKTFVAEGLLIHAMILNGREAGIEAVRAEYRDAGMKLPF